MEQIKLIKNLDLAGSSEMAADMEVNRLLDAPFRLVVEICLKNNAVLKRHSADVPITVLCLSGSGIFSAGNDLEDSQEMIAGTLITLEANVDHELIADPEIHILVTKFKAS